MFSGFKGMYIPDYWSFQQEKEISRGLFFGFHVRWIKTTQTQRPQPHLISPLFLAKAV